MGGGTSKGNFFLKKEAPPNFKLQKRGPKNFNKTFYFGKSEIKKKKKKPNWGKIFEI